MPDGESDFDAELNAIMSGGEPQATPSTPVEQTQAAETQKLKFGGREWDSPEKLGKAYEALHKDYTRKSQEFSRLKPYGDFDAYLGKHPELRTKINDAVAEYNKRVNAGQSQATAEKATGVSPEVADRIERMEAFFEDQKLEREIDQLKSKFSLDANDVKLVLHKATELAEKGAVLPLTDVFKILAYEERNLKAKQEGEKAGIQKMAAKNKANVGGSDNPSVTPSAKGVGEMSENEYTKLLTDKLEGLGFSG